MWNQRGMIKKIIAFCCIASLFFVGLMESSVTTQAKKKKAISLSKKKITLTVGSTYKIVIKNASKAKVTFQSSKKKLPLFLKRERLKQRELVLP